MPFAATVTDCVEGNLRLLSVLQLNDAGKCAGDGLRRLVFQRSGDVKVRVVVRCGQIRSNKWIFDHDRPSCIHRDWKPDASVTIANCRKPIPADGREERGAIDGSLATVLAHAQRNSVFVRNAGMRLWRNQYGQNGAAAGLHQLGNIEVAPYEGATHGSGLTAVHPDLCAVVDASKMKPDMTAFKAAGTIKVVRYQ